MSIINISGYKFIPLSELTSLKEVFLNECGSRSLIGTILLSEEGLNINLAGTPENIESFKIFLKSDERFSDITFHQTIAENPHYRRLRVRIKKEIITMRTPDIHPEITTAPAISPLEFKQWMDEKRDITILDTRNDYEIQFGTFDNAINPKINHFSEFVKLAESLDQEKPVVMFCTGGIRCEKAALHLLKQGFKKVFQLHKGILNYFKEVGGAHYHGECFVFDDRVSLNPDLRVSGTRQCQTCNGPIKKDFAHACENIPNS